jgi:hypothetical protein
MQRNIPAKFGHICFSDSWSLQAANQVLLLLRPIANPRWPPAEDIN